MEKIIRTTSVGPQDIGKGRTPETGGNITVRGYVPLTANITAVRAYIQNKPWGEGQCSLAPAGWVLATLDGGEPIGWCRARGAGRGSTEIAQWAAVQFQSWSHCNTREARLEIDYEIYSMVPDESTASGEIPEEWWKFSR